MSREACNTNEPEREAGDANNNPSDSSANLGLARLWISQCIQHHELCRLGNSSTQPGLLPTRLINVHDRSQPFLQVMKGEVLEPYLALSYRWGEGMMGQALKSTNEAYQRCLPLNDIPRTCWDAIQVTRMIGYKYLWIDAFCIIQDDEADKSRELLKMGEIYRHALFTIYAKGSSSSQSGLFSRKESCISQARRMQVCATIPLVDQGTETAEATLAGAFDGKDYLEERGWVLQESVLSSRRLAFGNWMSWKCTMARATETRPVLWARHNAETNGFAGEVEKLRMWIFAPARMREAPRQSWLRWNQFNSWYAVVEIYSTTNLTYVSDNLPALSGLAQLLQQTYRASYAAGLWLEDLQVGLTWYVASNDERKMPWRGDMAPSWSWAAVGKVRIRFRSWPSQSTHVTSEGLELLEASCEPEIPLNPYGGIKKGTLKVRIRLRKALLRYKPEYTPGRFKYDSISGSDYPLFSNVDEREQPQFPGLILDMELNHVIGEAALDTPIHLSQRLADSLDVSCMIESNPPASSEKEVWCGLVHVQETKERHQLTALVLEPVSDSLLVYRRLGLLFLTDQSWFGLSPSGPSILREVSDVLMDVIELI
ncbi:uncharacterized protein PAC_17375 [Phialocephala subalpina]|uniref:Heterokaryon incompatibility domain-containing protein n=1 Tax=Phialocephala subalpina TaxID=576137 RepID=A0A1L7XR03_9HELO|nr:uncharacterized protein PAC_17375 [Phialocephala subalpina]